MATSGPETKITKKCIDWAKKQPGVHAIKMHQGRYQAGQVDVLLCVDGHMVWVEMKVPGKEPTDLQAATMRTWAGVGATTACCHSLEEFQEVIVPLMAPR